jgi:hypothetical protein
MKRVPFFLLHGLISHLCLPGTIRYIAEVWKLTFRALDDVKESVRTAAVATAKKLGRVSILLCQHSHYGADAEYALFLHCKYAIEKKRRGGGESFFFLRIRLTRVALPSVRTGRLAPLFSRCLLSKVPHAIVAVIIIMMESSSFYHPSSSVIQQHPSIHAHVLTKVRISRLDELSQVHPGPVAGGAH